ncbi:MAG: WGR domain-containing protein [Anaerolineae bacterium]
MDWESPPSDFRFVLFERVEPEDNAHRFYLVGWLPTLLEEGAVVRLYGRKGGAQRTLTTPFSSLTEAWPFIRSVIKTRLRHGYRVVAPETYQATAAPSEDPAVEL